VKSNDNENKTVLISIKAHDVLRVQKFKRRETIKALIEEAIIAYFGGASKKDVNKANGGGQ